MQMLVASNDDENVIDDFLLNITPAETKPQKPTFDIVDEEQLTSTSEEHSQNDAEPNEEFIFIISKDDPVDAVHDDKE